MVDAVVPGSITFEWLEGGHFLVQRSRNEHELFPDAICVIGAPEEGEGLLMEYFDSRGVRRTYGISFEDGELRIWRDEPGLRAALRGDTLARRLRGPVPARPHAGRLAGRPEGDLPLSRLTPLPPRLDGGMNSPSGPVVRRLLLAAAALCVLGGAGAEALAQSDERFALVGGSFGAGRHYLVVYGPPGATVRIEEELGEPQAPGRDGHDRGGRRRLVQARVRLALRPPRQALRGDHDLRRRRARCALRDPHALVLAPVGARAPPPRRRRQRGERARGRPLARGRARHASARARRRGGRAATGCASRTGAAGRGSGSGSGSRASGASSCAPTISACGAR